MQQPPHHDGISPAVSLAMALFQQAGHAGRWRLSPDELRSLLGSLGITFCDDPTAAPGIHAVAFRVGLHNSREFGMVLRAGFGGIDADLADSNFRTDRAAVCAATDLTGSADFLRLFKRTLVYQQLARSIHSEGRLAPDEQLESLFARLLHFAREAAAGVDSGPFACQALELELRLLDDQVLACTAACEFASPPLGRFPRPIEKIDKLLHPASIGIVGVSATGMNFGRIILRNLVGSGYSKAQLVIIRPGETEIDGIRCVANLQALGHRLDLFIVAIAADAVGSLVDEILDSDAVDSVMLIPGGLGETARSRESAAALAAKINAAHTRPGGGPIFLGANCLGVVSHPGAYDSWFIPNERLPRPQKKAKRNSVMLSQSGAFMITRLSQNPWLDPNYMLALGNQTDLTHGDLLSYFAGRPDIETIGVYIEGFKDLDGLHFARAVRAAVLSGKQVVVYKAGRTAPGMDAVMGHTASVAGDATLFISVMRQAGAIVAEDVNDFDDLFYLAGALHNKNIIGNRLGAISGAGFEVVGMTDAIITDNFSMQMGELHTDTIARVQGILLTKRLDQLVEVRNPIDINPGADDETHLQIAEAFLQDGAIDAIVIGLDPTAPSVRALETSTLRPGYDINDEKSTVQLLPRLVELSDKPVIGIVDGGRLYDVMCERLMDQGVCVFRNSVRGTRALVRYVEARLSADAIRALDSFNPRHRK